VESNRAAPAAATRTVPGRTVPARTEPARTAPARTAPARTGPTRIALGDIEPNRRRGGDLRVLLSPKTAGATSGFMGALALQPGESVSEHRHPYSEEFLYVVRGSVLLRVDGETISLGPDESVMTPRNLPHRLENHGDEPAFCVFHLGPLAPRPELGHVDTEPQPGGLAAAPAAGRAAASPGKTG
jgi:putative monooxygenase